MIGFVDDTQGNVNDFLAETQPTPEELIKIMQYDAQLWSDLLWISGGLLELSKCSYHYIHFEFNESGQPQMTKTLVGPQLMLRDAEGGHDIQIKAFSVLRPHKTLGHFKSPEGNDKVHFHYLMKKANKMAASVATSGLGEKTRFSNV